MDMVVEVAVHHLYYLHGGDNVPRYVGITSDPRGRLQSHWRTMSRPPSRKDEWITELDRCPDMVIMVSTADRAIVENWESHFIESAAGLGLDLLNDAKPNGRTLIGQPFDGPHVDSAEAARIVGITPTQIRRYCSFGRLRFHASGGRLKIHFGDVMHLRDNRRPVGRPISTIKSAE